MIEDGFPTHSSMEQSATEAAVLKALEENPDPILFREKHKEFLYKALRSIPRKFECLDASRPWFVYWITQALDLLGGAVPSTISFLLACQSSSGGFGGGPMQLAHLAPTFAAVSAIVVSSEHDQELLTLNRPKLLEFLLSVKSPTGGFSMHVDGESDMRGTYCAIASASHLGLITKDLIKGVADYVMDCQTYEGGIAAHVGGAEAHGGYMYCGIATLGILSRILGREWFLENADKFKRMRWWCLQRQCLEGGFNGRTGKLVDSCYSFWIGASLKVLDLIDDFLLDGEGDLREGEWARVGLESYVLCACQNWSGGVRDKPGKNPDYYHTCYGLSGLAVTGPKRSCPCSNGSACTLSGNDLHYTSPLYNVRPERVAAFRSWLTTQQPTLGNFGWLD